MSRFLTNILTLLLATYIVACNNNSNGGVNVGNGKSNPNANASSWSVIQTEEANKLCRKDFPSYLSTVSKPELPTICECITAAASKVAVYEDYMASPTPFWQALHLNGQLVPCVPGTDISTSPPVNAPKWVKHTPMEEENGIATQPTLLRDRTGREIAIWLQEVPNNGFDILVRRMQANGWATIARVARVTSINAAYAAQVRADNALALVWVPDGKSVLAGEMPDGGSAVTFIKLTDNTPIAVQDVAITVDASDQAHIVWQETPPNAGAENPFHLMYRRYDGSNWSDAYELISGEIGKPRLITKGTDVLFVWQHKEAGIAGIMAKLFSKGTWTTMKMIDNANTNKWASSNPVIAASGEYAHVVFQSKESASTKLKKESASTKLNVRSFNWTTQGWADLTTIYSGPVVDQASIGTHGDTATTITWMTRGDSGITVMNSAWQLSNKSWLTAPIAVSVDSEPLVRPKLSVNNNDDKLLTFAVRKGNKSFAYAQVEKDGKWGNSEQMVETDKKIYDLFANFHSDGTAIGLWLEGTDLNYNKRE